MTEKQVESTTPKTDVSAEAAAPAADARPAGDTRRPRGAARGGDQRTGQGGRGGRGGDQRGGGRDGRGRGGRGRRDDQPQDEFESKIIDLARVTRVMAGGKRMSFRACVIVGDKKGRIGMGVKKGADVQLAVQKATNYAKKRLIQVPIVEGSIPHTVEYRNKGAIVLLKPAKEGTGLIAGGAVRVALEMAGVQNIVSKMKGSNNKINNLGAVIEALGSLSTKDAMKKQLKDKQAE